MEKKKNRIVNENDFPRNLDLYGKSKLRSEKRLLKIPNKTIKSILILRLSAILGKKSHSTFLSNLKSDFKKKKNIKIRNKENLFNGCLHVSDLAKFISKLLVEQKKGSDIINIASSKPIKLEKIINFFQKKYKKTTVTFLDQKKPTYIINVNKAIQKYNFQKINTDTTIKKYLELN